MECIPEEWLLFHLYAEANGWKVGIIRDFLKLSREEEAYIEIKFGLAEDLSAQRRRLRLRQSNLARKLKLSQSQVAKIEAGESPVSLDLLVRSLLALRVSGDKKGRIR
jgi:hypothetical protein